mmetsp:Transcript_17426/g.45526  ORF Transcript_17426/g.45526 Transcript_17426/m.45526 type:complete len:432 (+) Transcript_17426:205-1500(+)
MLASVARAVGGATAGRWLSRTFRGLCAQPSGSIDRDGGVVRVGDAEFAVDEMTNITPTILEKVGRGLLHVENHPLAMLKQRIAAYFLDRTRFGETAQFELFDNSSPAVTVEANFDSVLVPQDHVSRSLTDNYYINKQHMLRAHTSAHQVEVIQQGHTAFLLAGDVYRRDEIDRSHYPVFHQMEGVRLFPIHEVNRATQATVFGCHDRTETAQELHDEATAAFLAADLKRTLEGLVVEIFGDVECRWVDCYFPFTHPSFELEILFEGEWLEVLGCGVMEQQVLENADEDAMVGWAFGLGLERLAMVMYGIPDIRLFWSDDPRFLKQFDSSKPVTEQKFKPYSKYPPCQKDITFWVPHGFSANSFAEVVRGVAGDLVETVDEIDTFVHPKTKRESRCFRLTYRAMDRNLTNTEVNELQESLRADVAAMGWELR